MPEQSPRNGQVIVTVFGRTDVGRTREHNEDAFMVADLTAMNATLQPEVRTHAAGERGSLFMVADGMGGAAAGEIASSMAVEIVLDEMKKRWREAPLSDALTFATALKLSVNAANTRIHRFASEHPEHRGMGTTATAAGLLGDTLYLTQVGDSRAYLIRNGKATQITKDQSLMQKLVEAGEITAEEAEMSERRNIILQALGPETQIKIDLTSQKLRRGDVLVLCSDGLSGLVKGDEIAKVVVEEGEPMAACKRLIDMANANGGPDNITVIIARFDGDGLEPSSTSDTVGHSVYPVNDEDTPTLPMEPYLRRSNAPTVPVHRDEVEDDPSKRPTDPTGSPAQARPSGGGGPAAAPAPDDGIREVAQAGAKAGGGRRRSSGSAARAGNGDRSQGNSVYFYVFLGVTALALLALLAFQRFGT
jgi:protein phosphatase